MRVGDPVFVAGGGVAAAFVVDPLDQPAAERTDGGAEQERDRDPAVAGGVEEAHRQMPGLEATGGAAHFRRTERRRQDVRLGRERDRLLRRHIDVLAEARAGALVVCNQRGDGGVGAGVEIGLRDAEAHRGTIVVAGEDERTACGEDHQIAVGVAGFRAVLAERGDRDVDHAGIDAREIVGAEALLRQPAGVERFDHEVRIAGEVQEKIPTGGAGYVEGDAALVTGVGPPHQRVLRRGLIVGERAPAARRGAAGGFNRDHVGTEIAEELAAQESTPGGEIEDAVGAEHRRRRGV